MQYNVSEKGYSCDRCSRTYKWKWGLIQHQRYECGQKPQFSCPICPHKAKLKWNMEAHMKKKHNLYMYPQ